MAKIKVYDIQPPKEKTRVIPTSQKEKKKKEILTKLLLILAVFLVFIFILFQFLNASSATIEIWPKTKTVEFQAFLTITTSADQVDFLNQIIPAISKESEFVLAKKFQSSEIQIEEKARGTIRVYNKYSLPITLVAGTRFLSSTEPTRQFLSQRKITIPAGGYVDVEVLASEPGSDYNIDPCTFSVPGLRNFSPPQLYYSIFGKSFSKMKGGKIAKISKVTQEDLDKAYKILKAEAEAKALQTLQELAGSDYRLLKKTLKVEIVESGPIDAKIGQLTENFTYQVKAKTEAFVIKNSDLNDFIIKYVDSKIPPDQEINQESIEIKNLTSNIDIEGTITADIEFKVGVYQGVDVISIKEVAKNQKPKSITKYILEIYPEVERPPKIRLSPFFFRKAPKIPEKIEVIISFD
jgi:hypothetical protein